MGEKPPALKPHSGAKLRLIECYLNSYFHAVVRNPSIERLRITLVDGFCGGGAFDDAGLRVHGTPFLLLNAVQNAELRLNQHKEKPIKIDAQFHFVDESSSATAFLKEQLVSSGYLQRLGVDIFIHNCKFEEASLDIISSIEKRTAKGVGRSLFLLDQKGYTAAPLGLIRSIFAKFQKAECILTFAVDWLIDYLSERPETVAAVSPVELSSSQVKEFLNLKEEAGGRYVIQRLLLRHIRQQTNAEFASPFFIRSKEAKKDLWLLHLSRHATARNVMVDSHWTIKNHSIHQGRGGLEINGFNPDFLDAPNFMFSEHEEILMYERLSTDIIKRIRDEYGYNQINYGYLTGSIANETPARLADIDKVISFLVSEGELVLEGGSGGTKRNMKPSPADFVSINKQQRIIFPMPNKIGF